MEVWRVVWLLCKECCCQIEKQYLIALCLLVILQIYIFSIAFNETFDPLPGDLGVRIIDQSTTIHSTISDRLPSFTIDNSDYLFGAILVKHTMTSGLTLTMFALSRTSLRNRKGPNRIHENAEERWREMESHHGIPRGAKKSDTIFCAIAPSGQLDHTYIVESSHFTSTNMTDESANEMIDIIQCPMRERRSQFNLPELSQQLVFVRLFRRSYPTGAEVALLNFTIPWKTRRTGYMLSVPPHDPFTPHDHDPHQTPPPQPPVWPAPIHSSFNSWEGLPLPNNPVPNPSFYLSVTLSNDRLTAHLMGSASPPSISSAAHLLEFIYHHLSIGFKHIFLSVKYSFGSARMRTLLLVLRHAIEVGSVTVVSQSSDGIDGTSSTDGMTWTESFLRNYHHTVCYYLLKGMNEEFISLKVEGQRTGSILLSGGYLAMWGLDSFLIPSAPHKTIHDVIHSHTNQSHNQHISLLRGDPHSVSSASHFCSLLIFSEKIIDRYPPHDSHDSPFFPWLTDRFAQGESYFLLNTNLEEMSRRERSASALLSIASDGVNGTLYEDYGLLLPIHQQFSFASLPTQEYCEEEGKGVSLWSSSSSLYRIMSRRHRYDQHNSRLVSATNNEYSVRYAEKVAHKLRELNLDIVVMADLASESHLIGTKDEHWRRFSNPDSRSA
jgi:hypothetical protein